MHYKLNNILKASYYLLMIGFFVFFILGCSIEKRVHKSGYHVTFYKKYKSQKKETEPITFRDNKIFEQIQLTDNKDSVLPNLYYTDDSISHSDYVLATKSNDFLSYKIKSENINRIITSRIKTFSRKFIKDEITNENELKYNSWYYLIIDSLLLLGLIFFPLTNNIYSILTFILILLILFIVFKFLFPEYLSNRIKFYNEKLNVKPKNEMKSNSENKIFNKEDNKKYDNISMLKTLVIISFICSLLGIIIPIIAVFTDNALLFYGLLTLIFPIFVAPRLKHSLPKGSKLRKLCVASIAILFISLIPIFLSILYF